MHGVRFRIVGHPKGIGFLLEKLGTETLRRGTGVLDVGGTLRAHGTPGPGLFLAGYPWGVPAHKSGPDRG